MRNCPGFHPASTRWPPTYALSILTRRYTVPIATRYPPDNVRFEIVDVRQFLRFSNDSIDFVHARSAFLGVSPPL